MSNTKRTAAEIVAAYDRTSTDAVSDADMATLVAAAKALCASWEINPRAVEYVNGPDEWGVVKGAYTLNSTNWHTHGPLDYVAIEDADLCALLSVIDDQESGIESLWTEPVNCEDCQDTRRHLMGNGDAVPCVCVPQASDEPEDFADASSN